MKDKVQAELEELQEQKANIEQRLSASERKTQDLQEQLSTVSVCCSVVYSCSGDVCGSVA